MTTHKVMLEFTMPQGFMESAMVAPYIEEAMKEVAEADPSRSVPFTASNGVRIDAPDEKPPTQTEVGAFLKRCDPRLVADYVEDDINLMVNILEVMNRPFPCKPERVRPMEVFIDCEWNGHGGDLITLALVAMDGQELYLAVPLYEEVIPWVAENVVPVLGQVMCVSQTELAYHIRDFLALYPAVHLIADWPEDIERFCHTIVTGPGERIDTPPLTIEIRRDLDAADSAIPHNALEDARAMRSHYLTMMGDA